jgi:hypothetical protein
MQNVPLPQLALQLTLPSTVVVVPRGHSWQNVIPACGWYCVGAHGLQAKVEFAALASENRPGWQRAHVLVELAPSSALYLPGRHGMHSVSSPLDAKYLPAVHFLQCPTALEGSFAAPKRPFGHKTHATFACSVW